MPYQTSKKLNQSVTQMKQVANPVTAAKSLAKKTSTGKVIPVPDGNPIFLFFTIKGRTRPLNVFGDSGCSHAVFKDGVPRFELNGILTAKGPISIGVAGGVNVTAKEEWMVSLPKTNGDLQTVVGLTMDKVTMDFPKINVEEAVADIKADAGLKNEFVQKCIVPPVAGGSVDIMLGTHYNAIMPKLKHMLPCGLGIYEV